MDKTKQEILKALEYKCKEYPDMRMGQLLDNIAAEAHIAGIDVFYLEDEDYLQRIREYQAY